MSEGHLFDHYATSYDEALSHAIGPSGEDREYFAKGRIAWLKRCLREVGQRPGSVLDYGCGDGSTTPLLLAMLEAQSAVGVDISEKSIEIARARYASERISYESADRYQPSSGIDLTYCNGVFHHIPLCDRRATVAYLHAALRPAGLLAIWENSPWNPATRYVMSRCAFDKDAILVSPREMKRLLRGSGFQILRTDFQFIFPRTLRALRPIEKFVYRFPIGAQYQVLARA
jgi:SAM-dependent methyltransferase